MVLPSRCSVFPGSMDKLARAAITIYLRPGAQTTEMHFPTVMEAGSPRSRCPQCCFFWGFYPWLVDVHLLHPVTLHVCILISSSYEDSSHIGVGPPLWALFWLNYPFKDPISEGRPILRHQRFGLRHMKLSP